MNLGIQYSAIHFWYGNFQAEANAAEKAEAAAAVVVPWTARYKAEDNFVTFCD